MKAVWAENARMLKTDLHRDSSPGEFTVPVTVFLDCKA